MFKSRRVKWIKSVTGMEKMRTSCKILVRKPHGKTT
jgi:hypothetical protein